MKPSSSAPRRRKAARRSEILAAAREVFSSRPFEQAAMSEIAARAGCVEGTIYTYFRSKRDLFDSVLADFYDVLIEDIAPRFEAIHATPDRLRFLIARHLLIAVEDPGVSRMITRESRGPSLYFGSKLHALNRRYSRFLLQTISEGIQRGDLRADLDPAIARDLVFGGLEHWIWNELGRQRSFDPVKSADRFVRTLLDGWKATGGGDALDELRLRVGRLEAQAAAVREPGRRGARDPEA